jgi:hypothetical protein
MLERLLGVISRQAQQIGSVSLSRNEISALP